VNKGAVCRWLAAGSARQLSTARVGRCRLSRTLQCCWSAASGRWPSHGWSGRATTASLCTWRTKPQYVCHRTTVLSVIHISTPCLQCFDNATDQQ